MRLIYLDEAGTSPAEPVRIVASVIVHADDQARLLVDEIAKVVKNCVPSNIQSRFIFHALEVYNGGRRVNRLEWAQGDRLDFLKQIVRLPFIHDVPIAVGVTFNGTYDESVSSAQFAELKAKGITKAVFEHGMAFASCMARSDLFLRKYLDGKETSVAVAENIDSARKALGLMAMIYRDNPRTVPSSHQMASALEKHLGEQPPDQTEIISNILDVPHFVEKRGAPLLQLADACAFSFRRYLSKQRHGDELIISMLGPEQGSAFLEDEVWFSGASSGLFNTLAYWDEDQRKVAYDRMVTASFLDFFTKASN